MTSKNTNLFSKVVLFGLPNSGKSTILNAIIGSKVSIVSNKRQTTRNEVSSFVEIGDRKILLSDTPGLIDAKKDLISKQMSRIILSSIEHCDALILVVDASFSSVKTLRDILKLDEMVSSRDVSTKYLCLSKVDKLSSKDKLLPMLSQIQKNDNYNFRDIFITSALRGKGLSAMIKEVSSHLDPTRQVESRAYNHNFFLSELTRETIMDNFYDEIPYSVFVATDIRKKFEKKDEVLVRQRIIISNERQRRILIGRGGSALSRLGKQSRAKMEAVYHKKHHLFLDIIVDCNWQENYLNKQ